MKTCASERPISERASAEQFLKRALDTDPRHADAAQTLAALYEEQRNPQRALQLLEDCMVHILAANYPGDNPPEFP